jgi:hypothetical protein
MVVYKKMFGLDNNVLMVLVGVVLVFCLMTNKKSFKSLMKGNTLVIIGLTLLLLCCMAKGGRVVEGFEVMDLIRRLETSHAANRERICGQNGDRCSLEHHDLMNDGQNVPVIRRELITPGTMDDHRGFLSFLKESGMGGIEHVEFNLEANIQRVLSAEAGLENVRDSFDGDNAESRAGLLSALNAIRPGENPEIQADGGGGGGKGGGTKGPGPGG